MNRKRYSLFEVMVVILWLFTADFVCAAPIESAEGTGNLIPIHDIQGSGLQTRFFGKSVSTSGVVTGITRGGFFIQALEKEYDRDDNTSEGIFVQCEPDSFPEVKTGFPVRVDGLAFEDKSFYGSMTQTIIASISAVTLLEKTPVSLPKPLVISAKLAKPKAAPYLLEKYEGMRVCMKNARVVGPSIGKNNEESGTSQSYGIFYVTFPEFPRPFRESGLEPHLMDSYLNDLEGLGEPDAYDGNNEIIKIDTGSQIGRKPLDVSTGAVISNITGILGTSFGNYGIIVDSGCNIASRGTLKAVPIPKKRRKDFRVASFNMEKFYDRVDDPQVRYDIAVSHEGIKRRLNKVSLVVSTLLKFPEIISVQEVENLAILEEIAAAINEKAHKMGLPDPKYKGIMIEGNCPSGLDIGFLVKTSCAKVLEATQLGKDLKITDPNSKNNVLVNLRPPLILRVTIDNASEKPFDLTIINNHFKSYVKINDPKVGPFIVRQRQAQAEYLAGLVELIQKKNPRERILLVGDFNAPTGTDGLLDVIGIIRGEPRNSEVLFPGRKLVKNPLFDISVMVAKKERYSYVYNGSAEVLDHVLVNNPLVPFVAGMHFVHCNSDFADSFRNDAQRPERFSDHDIPVVTFQSRPFSMRFADLKKRLESMNRARGTISRAERRLESDLNNLCREYIDHYVQTGKAREISRELDPISSSIDSELLNYVERKNCFRNIQKDY